MIFDYLMWFKFECSIYDLTLKVVVRWNKYTKTLRRSNTVGMLERSRQDGRTEFILSIALSSSKEEDDDEDDDDNNNDDKHRL